MSCTVNVAVTGNV